MAAMGSTAPSWGVSIGISKVRSRESSQSKFIDCARPLYTAIDHFREAARGDDGCSADRPHHEALPCAALIEQGGT